MLFRAVPAFEICRMKHNKKSLAEHFGIDPRTLNKLHLAYFKEIGPYIGRAWTPGQVKKWMALYKEGVIESKQEVD